jgi:hypothetical protein
VVKKHEISPEGAVVTEGLISGLFFGIYLKTGLSVDPTDLMINVLNQTQQIAQSMPHSIDIPNYVPIISLIITILTLLATIATIFSVKNRIFGIFLYLIGFLFMFGIVLYAYH